MKWFLYTLFVRPFVELGKFLFGLVGAALLLVLGIGLWWAAYAAVGGRGYGRVDLRQDRVTGEIVVLEVNAQCGISEDEAYTSIGAILRFARACIAPADANLLARRCRRDVEAVDARQFHQRIAVGIVERAGAAIERRAEQRGIGAAASADPRSRLDHHDAASGSRDTPRRRKTRRPRADHDNVILARQRRGHDA